MPVPTNKELYDNAPDTVEEAIRGWLARHVRPLNTSQSTLGWYEWASKNFMNDPEIRGAYKKEFGID